jgi:hypothetical protein
VSLVPTSLLADVCLGFPSASRQPAFRVGVVGGASVHPSIKLARDLRERAHVLAWGSMTNHPAILGPVGHVEAVEVLQGIHYEDIWRLVELRKHERLSPLTGDFARDISPSHGLPVSCDVFARWQLHQD